MSINNSINNLEKDEIEKVRTFMYKCWKNQTIEYNFLTFLTTEFNGYCSSKISILLSDFFLDFFYKNNVFNDYLINLFFYCLATKKIVLYDLVTLFYEKMGNKKKECFDNYMFFKKFVVDVFVVYFKAIRFEEDLITGGIRNLDELKLLFRMNLTLLEFAEYYLKKNENDDNYCFIEDTFTYVLTKLVLLILENERMVTLYQIMKLEFTDLYAVIESKLLLFYNSFLKSSNLLFYFLKQVGKFKLYEGFFLEQKVSFRRIFPMKEIKERLRQTQQHQEKKQRGFSIVGILCVLIEKEFVDNNIFLTQQSYSKFKLLMKYYKMEFNMFFMEIAKAGFKRINNFTRIAEEGGLEKRGYKKIYQSDLLFFGTLWKYYLLVKLPIIFRKELNQKNIVIILKGMINQKNDLFKLEDGSNMLHMFIKQFINLKFISQEEIIHLGGDEFRNIFARFEPVPKQTQEDLFYYPNHKNYFNEPFLNKNLILIAQYLFKQPKKIQIFHIYGLVPQLLNLLVMNLENVETYHSNQKEEKYSMLFSVIYSILEDFNFSKNKYNNQFFKNNIVFRNPKLKIWFYGFLNNSDTGSVTQSSPKMEGMNKKLFQQYVNKEQKYNIQPSDKLFFTSYLVKNILLAFTKNEADFQKVVTVIYNYIKDSNYLQIAAMFSLSNSYEFQMKNEEITIKLTLSLFAKLLRPIISFNMFQKIFERMKYKEEKELNFLNHEYIFYLRFSYLRVHTIKPIEHLRKGFLKSGDIFRLSYNINDLYALELFKDNNYQFFFDVVICRRLHHYMKERERTFERSKALSELLGIILSSTIDRFLINYIPNLFISKQKNLLQEFENYFHSLVIVLLICRNEEIKLIKKFLKLLNDIMKYNKNEYLQKFILCLLKEVTSKLPELIMAKTTNDDNNVNVEIANTLDENGMNRIGVFLFDLKNKVQREKCLIYTNNLQ